MSANVGDRITLHGNTTGAPDRTGTIVAVLGADGPPYRVRFDSGEETIVSPGPDATLAPPTMTERLERAAQRTNEIATEAVGRARESAQEYTEKARESSATARESAQEYTEKARVSAQDATGRAARKVADAASKVADRFQR